MGEVIIIGAGLAGCEAAYQVAKRGHNVKLYEMKPKKYSPAHHSENFGELVCSNSLRSEQIENAVGLLKEEMRLLDSLIMRCADNTRVPAGGALAVDRQKFSEMITSEIKSNPNITIINEEVTKIPEDGLVIIATGPLTSDDFGNAIREYLKDEYFYFFDAAAPIVSTDTIDMTKAFKSSRYDKGEDDYINCPMTEEQYRLFWTELINAELADVKDFDTEIVFEGCIPVEVMAKRGYQTLLYGPLKPVGLINPNTGRQPFAVVQLRQDNKEGTMVNIVGFQTRLKWGEQKRIFSMIPGLENAEFLRLGVMHRNTYINSPKLLMPSLQLRKNQKILFAGQITGVEGYVESSSSGLIAGINAANLLDNKEVIVFPKSTAHGALCHYISDSNVGNFQPMNVNFSLFELPKEKIRDKKLKKLRIAEIALEKIKSLNINI